MIFARNNSFSLDNLVDLAKNAYQYKVVKLFTAEPLASGFHIGMVNLMDCIAPEHEEILVPFVEKSLQIGQPWWQLGKEYFSNTNNLNNSEALQNSNVSGDVIPEDDSDTSYKKEERVRLARIIIRDYIYPSFFGYIGNVAAHTMMRKWVPNTMDPAVHNTGNIRDMSLCWLGGSFTALTAMVIVRGTPLRNYIEYAEDNISNIIGGKNGDLETDEASLIAGSAEKNSRMIVSNVILSVSAMVGHFATERMLEGRSL